MQLTIYISKKYKKVCDINYFFKKLSKATVKHWQT